MFLIIKSKPRPADNDGGVCVQPTEPMNSGADWGKKQSRLRKKLGLVRLEPYRLSPAAVQLERGRRCSRRWRRSAKVVVFSVELDYFFADHRKHPSLAVVFHAARLRFPEAPGRRDPRFISRA